MISADALISDLQIVLRWQMANPDRDDGPAVPMCGQRIWGLFLRLHEGRGGGFGPAPISHEAMAAFSAITGEPLRAWEIEIIRALDREWLKAAAGAREPSANLQKVSGRPMSPALFDAMFANS